MIHINIQIFSTDKSEDSRERDQLRQERHKDRARERNLARAAPDKRSRLQRERERDISEQIALGLPAKSIPNTGEAQFDQRLFNTSKGMDSGYGHDDEYNVYDKPWKDSNSIASHIYRPNKNIDKDTYGDDLEKLVKTNKLGYFYFYILRDVLMFLIILYQNKHDICLIDKYLFEFLINIYFVLDLFLTKSLVEPIDRLRDLVQYNLKKMRRILSVWINS